MVVQQQHRPRLADLRAKLRADPADSPQRRQPLLKPTTATTNNTSTNDETNIQTLRKQLAKLPELPSAPSSSILTARFHRQHTYLRLSVTERCNLRCTYCMPEQGVPLQPSSQLLTTTELLTLARHFSQQGVTKFRLTGGEPTLRSDLLTIVDGLAQLPTSSSIGMTTNGIALGTGNGKLQALHQAGLTSLNISLDTLDAAQFATLTRRPASYLQRVLQCLEQAVDLATTTNTSFVVKLNVVVMRGINDQCVADFIRLGAQRYGPHLQVRFIEYMPFSDNGWNWDKCVPYRELLQNLRQVHGMELTPLPADDPHDTTKWFTYNGNSNKIGFITSMSHHFCGTCNRLRLTADGQIKVCLFDGSSEISLRDALRAGCTTDELNRLIYAAVQTKHAALGGHSDPADIMKDAANNRPMTLIGG